MKKLKYRYFRIRCKYKNRHHHGGVHVVRANDGEDALRIANKYNIGLPMGNPDVDERYIVAELFTSPNKMIIKIDEKSLKRRRKGLGGSVWYEDENGQLQKETI